MRSTPIYTIQKWDQGTRTFYFDLMSDLTFAVSQDEILIMKSPNPNDCMKELFKFGCILDLNVWNDYSYLKK